MREPTQEDLKMAMFQISARVNGLCRGQLHSQRLYDKIDEVLKRATMHYRLKGLDFPKLLRVRVADQIYILRADLDRRSISMQAHNMRREHPEVPFERIVAELARAYQLKPVVLN